jgi:hypothetical protein
VKEMMANDPSLKGFLCRTTVEGWEATVGRRICGCQINH